MFNFFGLKVADRTGELGIIIAQLIKLLTIVPVDFGLDGNGTGHCRLGPQQRRSRTQRKARNMPERLQQRRADTPIHHHAVEAFEVPRLLRRHVANRAS